MENIKKKWYQTKLGIVAIWIISLAVYPIGIPFLIIWYTRRNPKLSDKTKKVVAGAAVVLGILLAVGYSSAKPSTTPPVNNENQPAVNTNEVVVQKEDLKPKLQEEIERLKSYDNWDPSKLDKDTLLLTVVSFNLTSHLAEQGEADSDPATAALGKELATKQIAIQVKYFPLIRKAWADIFKDKAWESDMDVIISGAKFDKIEFIAGAFAANKNIKDFHLSIFDALKALRFKEDSYRWMKYADGTAFKIDSLQDSELDKLTN